MSPITKMRALLTGLALALVLVVGPAPASASPLDDARAAGYVGEMPDGYVGLVDASAPADVQALIDQVNAQRRAKYESLAAEQGVPIEQVGAVTAEKLISQKLQPGWYYMDSSGSWIQR